MARGIQSERHGHCDRCDHDVPHGDHCDLGEDRAYFILSVLRGHGVNKAMTGYCSRAGAFLGKPAHSTRLLVRLERVDPHESRALGSERWLPLQRLATDARWTVQGERIDVWLEGLSMANADAQGTGQAHWHTGDPATSPARARFPGVLDLSATLTRGDATRVHRYLPLTLHTDVRRYVREAVRGGSSSRVGFRVQGRVDHVPFDKPGDSGEFRITAALKNVDFAYLPPHLQSASDVAWPALRGVSGELLLDRVALKLSGLQGSVVGAPKSSWLNQLPHRPIAWASAIPGAMESAMGGRATPSLRAAIHAPRPPRATAPQMPRPPSQMRRAPMNPEPPGAK
mgnify:CR=1 FL=1